MTCEVREVTKKTSAPLRRLPVAIFAPKRASCEAGCERSNTRALKVVAVAAAAAPLGHIHAKASKLRSRLRALKYASAQSRRGRRCGGSLRRYSRQSEQVAKQVASAQTRERSNRLDGHRQAERRELLSDEFSVLTMRRDHKRQALFVCFHRATGGGRQTQACEAAQRLDHKSHLIHFIVVKKHVPKRKLLRWLKRRRSRTSGQAWERSARLAHRV